MVITNLMEIIVSCTTFPKCVPNSLQNMQNIFYKKCTQFSDMCTQKTNKLGQRNYRQYRIKKTVNIPYSQIIKHISQFPLYDYIFQFKKKKFFNLVTLAYHISLNKISLWGREHIKRSTQYAFPSKACHIKILIKKLDSKVYFFLIKKSFPGIIIKSKQFLLPELNFQKS